MTAGLVEIAARAMMADQTEPPDRDTLARAAAVLSALREAGAIREEPETNQAACHDCKRPYGDENGFPDLIIPFESWKEISPNGDDAGLLCPSCICKRLHDKGMRCEGAFMSGPIESLSRSEMYLYRRVENIELALEGRMNRWGKALAIRAVQCQPLPQPPEER